MKFVLLIMLTMLMVNSDTRKVIFDFEKGQNLNQWLVINDGVMGGLSRGYISLNDEGNADFFGDVSLENNGGFSSVRHRFSPLNVEQFSKITVRLKGDGKRYQFRVKTNAADPHSYITYFTTNGEWQIVEINLSDLYPTFRGRQLNMPNYPRLFMSEIAFLIANKKAESFKLEVDHIYLHP